MYSVTIRNRTLRWLIVALLIAVFCMWATSVASACPTCKNALDSDESGGDVVRGYFWSILFMMSMPFAVLGSFSGYLYLMVRKARAAAGSDGQMTTHGTTDETPEGDTTARH